jgi:sulfur carrier protein
LQETVQETLTISVNGERVTCQAATLDKLLGELGYGDAKVATALNGEFIPAATRSQTRLANDDSVEIVAPRQGG